MKVLQVNVVYDKGSTGKIMCNIRDELLHNGHEAVICYGRGEKTNDKNVYKTCSELYSKLNNLLTRFTGIMYGGCFFSTNRLISVIKKENPDIVHLHCLNGYFVNVYKLITWLKKHKIKTVLTLHAEFMHTANCGHAFECEKWKSGCGSCPRLKQETKSVIFDGTHRSWMKMKKAFDGFYELTVVSVSPWLMERAKQSPILSGCRHLTVPNGLDTKIFHPCDASDLKNSLGIRDEKVILHVTPFFSSKEDDLKGGRYILKLAEKIKNENVKILVAGDHERNLSAADNLMLLGKIKSQQELSKLYSLADVTVIASKRETFSMVVAESLCCGTPVVGFYAGGPESIALPECSTFVEYGNVDALYDAIQSDFSQEKCASFDEYAQAEYSRSSMYKKYEKIYLKSGEKM